MSPPGKHLTMILPDSLIAYVDGDSVLDIDFDGTNRTVKLLRSLIFFDTVRNEQQPFLAARLCVARPCLDMQIIGIDFA